jgi:hypothetical protein
LMDQIGPLGNFMVLIPYGFHYQYPSHRLMEGTLRNP